MVDDKVDMHNVRNVFIVSTMLLIGLGGVIIGWTLKSTVMQFSGTSVAIVVGIVLNLVLPNDRGIDLSKMLKVKGKASTTPTNDDINITNRF